MSQTTDLTAELAPGTHPRDASVPLVPGQSIDSDNAGIDGNALAEQGARRSKPWATDNESAFPVNQRSASQWSANAYTLGTTPIQLAGKLKGRVSVTVWVPTSAAHGVVITPEEGDITQGAGVELDPGDSITLDTEAAVWGGVISGQTAGSCQVVQLYNPPGGGLGLSAG